MGRSLYLILENTSSSRGRGREGGRGINDNRDAKGSEDLVERIWYKGKTAGH
jgi:hypothetical protein